MEETFQPMWAELQDEFLAQRELLDEVRKSLEPTSAVSELARLRADRDRWQAIAGLYEVQMSVIEPALWRAEQEAAQALLKLHDATKTVGRGQRRTSGQSRAEQLYELVERDRRYAELDGKLFILEKAVRRAATSLDQKDSKGVQLPPDQLAELVSGRLQNYLSTYRKERSLRRKAGKWG